jgi:hypothetical protein
MDEDPVVAGGIADGQLGFFETSLLRGETAELGIPAAAPGPVWDAAASAGSGDVSAALLE